MGYKMLYSNFKVENITLDMNQSNGKAMSKNRQLPEIHAKDRKDESLEPVCQSRPVKPHFLWLFTNSTTIFINNLYHLINKLKCTM